MGSGTKMIMVALLSLFFLLQGCSDGGGGSSSGSSGGSVTTTQNGLFLIKFEDNMTNIFDYELSIKRKGEELTDTMLEYISHKKESDGSIVITLKEVTANGVSNGLTALEVGDVITLEAKGYTPQQFVVDADMLNNASNEIVLKAIESRQTFNLSDMIAGVDSVAPKSARGARTVVTDDSVIFETVGSGISLEMPKLTYERLVRKISRLPRSNTNTQVHIDMTSVDPRTEHSVTIGDFTYDPTSEPSSERTTNATDAATTALESVVMADMRMTTDSGDEIHCFDGEYDPDTNRCSGNATATLKMQIPQSQFNQYAQKYNDGDRVVPLYSYNKAKARWVRQLDSNGVGLDAELVLTDNDSNQKANEGDVLTLVGKVGHFSWWNGDYPVETTCLDVKLDLSKAPYGASRVQVKGVDYVGRIFRKSIEANATEVKDISAKTNSIVSIELIMKDGSVGDSITYSTGDGTSESCEVVTDVLTAPAMNSHLLDVIVKDTEGNSIENATVRASKEYEYTDSDGKAKLAFSYALDTNLSETVYVSYNNGSFTARGQQDITQDDSSITIILDIAEITFKGSVVEVVNGVATQAADAYVQIRNYNPYYYKSVKTDENGSFEINLPKSRVEKDSTATIYISKYNRDYAFYPRFSKEITLSPESPDLGQFKLAFITHTVSGKVTDTRGNPIASASIYARGGAYKYSKSDENGNYKFTILDDVDQNVTLQASIYKDRSLYSDKKSFITEENGQTSQDLTIDMRKAIIKGKVLSSDGIALENMRVYWSKDHYSYVVTDANGSFSLETYNGGDGYIRVYNPSSYKYLDFNANIDIRDVVLNGVEVGQIYNLENLLVVEENFAPIISGIAIDPSTPIKDVPFTINIDAYDPDSDAITYEIEEYYNRYNPSITISGNIATVTASTYGYYYFKVTATDVHGNRTQKRVSVYVKDHARPVIDSVTYVFPNAKRYFDKSEPLVIKTEAHSIEGNTLSYSYKLAGLSFGVEDVLLTPEESDPSKVTIPTNVANGRYRLTIAVSDVYNTTTTRRYITIDGSVAPEIDTFKMNDTIQSNITIKENESVSFDVNLTDADNVTDAQWYWYINGKTFNTQAIDPITFASEGYYYGYVTVRDSKGRSDSRSFYITVSKNAKPVIDSINVTPSLLTKVGDKFVDANNIKVSDLTLNVVAHDDDSSSLTYSFGKLDNNDANVSENNATYSLDGLSARRYSIKVTVGDGSKSVDSYVNVEILKDAPPVIREFRVPLKAKVSTTLELVSNATDANGEDLTYTWTTTAGTLQDANSKKATLEVSEVVQDINVTLTVRDGSNEVSRTRTIDVVDNMPPVIRYFNLRTPTVNLDNQKIKLKSIYGDVDGEIENAKYIIADANGTVLDEKMISQSNIVTSWELDLNSTGKYKVYLKVTDDNNATTLSNKAGLSVKKANSGPVITSLTADSTNLLVGEETVLNVAVSDADGDPISITWSVSPTASFVVDASAQDKATFSAISEGQYTITAIATDRDGLQAIKTIELSVQSAKLRVDTNSSSYTPGSDVTLTAVMSSGHTIPPSTTTWSIVSKPDNSTLTISSTGASITITPDVVGTYKIKADTLINGVAFSAETSFSVGTGEADLEGSVKSDSGDTLRGAKVRLYNKTDSSKYDVTVTTDSNGAYSFSDVPAGSYYLVVYAGNGYVSQTQVIEIN